MASISRYKRDLKSWYDELASSRTAYLNRAEKVSEQTLPWYVKADGTQGQTLESVYQSVGAEGVHNLASKLIMVLMPPNRPMFRLRVARKIIEEAAQSNKGDMLTEVNSGLSRIETETTGLIEGTGDRTQLYSAMTHLIIAGNVLLYIKPDGMKVYSLRNYVVQRDPDGNPLVIIVKEEIAEEALPVKVRRAIKPAALINGDQTTGDFKIYELYTAIVRKNDGWHVRQECEGITVGKPGTYPLDECPWLPLRLYRSEEEDYGRGYVEQYYGSLFCLTELSKAVLQASAAASKILFLVHPASTTKADTLTKADNLSFVQGNAADIDVLQLDKLNDLKVAQAQIQELNQQLSKVFLMNTSIQRNAERVTAEEIRFMAQELETSLGGLYSVLAKEFQKPYITLRIKYFQADKRIDPFDKNVKVEIITGVDALGRGQDANTLVQYGTQIFKTLPPQAVMSYVNIPGYLKSLAAAYGIDDTAILKSEQQIAEEQQQAQQLQLLQQGLPAAINAGGKILDTQMKGEQTNG